MKARFSTAFEMQYDADLDELKDAIDRLKNFLPGPFITDGMKTELAALEAKTKEMLAQIAEHPPTKPYDPFQNFPLLNST